MGALPIKKFCIGEKLGWPRNHPRKTCKRLCALWTANLFAAGKKRGKNKFVSEPMDAGMKKRVLRACELHDINYTGGILKKKKEK